MIPSLNAVGELPAGVHATTLEEVEAVFAKTPKRRTLFEGLKRTLENLKGAGVRRVYIDGSFVTDKVEPNDIDGCWEITEHVRIEEIDPVFLELPESRNAMKEKYGVDLFLASWVEAGSGLPFVEFFQISREGKNKGILVIELGESDD